MHPRNNSILRKHEIRIIAKAARYVPSSIGTKALTYFAFLTSPIIFLGYVIASSNRLGLIIASVFIFLQWLFDCLDGTIGRLRGEGFVKWGFYMDHLFDFIFLSSILLGLMYAFRDSSAEILIVYFLASTLMFSFILLYGTEKPDTLQVSFLFVSPTEARILAIILNLSAFFFPVIAPIIVKLSAYVAILVLSSVLCYKIYVDQRLLDRKDRERKPQSRSR